MDQVKIGRFIAACRKAGGWTQSEIAAQLGVSDKAVSKGETGKFLPDYPRYGRGAPFRRNLEIATHADALLAFWDGQSRGTRHTIELCRAAGMPVTVILLA